MLRLGLLKYLSGALGALLVISNVAWYTAYQSKEAERLAAVVADNTTKANYKQAQADAAIKAYEEKIKVDEENQRKAKAADASYSDLLARYNASILRLQSKALSGSTGVIDLSSTSTATRGDYSESESTRISITMTDAGICAENTARLKAVHEWGEALQK